MRPRACDILCKDFLFSHHLQTTQGWRGRRPAPLAAYARRRRAALRPQATAADGRRRMPLQQAQAQADSRLLAPQQWQGGAGSSQQQRYQLHPPVQLRPARTSMLAQHRQCRLFRRSAAFKLDASAAAAAPWASRLHARFDRALQADRTSARPARSAQRTGCASSTRLLSGSGQAAGGGAKTLSTRSWRVGIGGRRCRSIKLPAAGRKRL
jgi:hypothetical protein